MFARIATHNQIPLLRIFLIGFVVLGALALLFVSNDEPAQAAPQLTLFGNDTLIVKRSGCTLGVSNVKKTSLKVNCAAFTPTPTNTATPTDTATATPTETETSTETATPTSTLESGALGVSVAANGAAQNITGNSERAQNTGATITRTLKPNKSLKVLASGCELQVKKKTAKRVVVFCKPNPTPTPTNTTAPSTATVYVRNLTGGTLCYEIHGTGIGQKCFGGGDSLYGTFTSGTYAWSASANCGTANGSTYYPPGNWLVTFACNSADLRQIGEMAPHASAPPN